jgi:hypothetical protein
MAFFLSSSRPVKQADPDVLGTSPSGSFEHSMLSFMARSIAPGGRSRQRRRASRSSASGASDAPPPVHLSKIPRPRPSFRHPIAGVYALFSDWPLVDDNAGELVYAKYSFSGAQAKVVCRHAIDGSLVLEATGEVLSPEMQSVAARIEQQLKERALKERARRHPGGSEDGLVEGSGAAHGVEGPEIDDSDYSDDDDGIFPGDDDETLYFLPALYPAAAGVNNDQVVEEPWHIVRVLPARLYNPACGPRHNGYGNGMLVVHASGALSAHHLVGQPLQGFQSHRTLMFFRPAEQDLPVETRRSARRDIET